MKTSKKRRRSYSVTTKAAVAAMSPENSAALMQVGWRNLATTGVVLEPFTGAWQRNIVADPAENLMMFSPAFAGVSLIASDIAKMRLKLTELNEDGTVWREITEGASAYLPVIRKPNRYQTRSQFVSCWIISKLLNGNTYVLKVRDARNVVVSLYILSPFLTTPITTDDGGVYYRLKRDPLSEVTEEDTVVPASEIIHDRMMCLWHPLVGVSPLYGCGQSVTQGLRIQNNSNAFFSNMSRPSGILTAPAKISDETALRLKKHWEENYAAANIGKLAVLGDGLHYEAMTIPAQQSQLLEQLKNTAEDVARVLHIPLHMLQVGGAPPLASIGAINQLYYSQALQGLINDLEDCFADGLGLPYNRSVEFDLDDLLRLDPQSRADASAKAIGAGYMKPNEARQKENMEAVEGGDTPYLQVQNYSLAALAERDQSGSLVPPSPPVAPAQPDPAAATRELLDVMRKGLEHV